MKAITPVFCFLFSVYCSLLASACAPLPHSDSKKDWQEITQACRPMMEREARFQEHAKLFKQQFAAAQVFLNKCQHENAAFLASLSDQEVSAYSAYTKANRQGSAADEELAWRNFTRLLSKSGKLDAWLKLYRDLTELGAQREAIKKQSDELDAEAARDEQEDQQDLAEWNATMNEVQQMQMQQSLQGINDQLFWMNFNHPGKY